VHPRLVEVGTEYPRHASCGTATGRKGKATVPEHCQMSNAAGVIGVVGPQQAQPMSRIHGFARAVTMRFDGLMSR